MQDVVPKILAMDGYLFIDRFDVGEAALRTEAIERYGSLLGAQPWMNTVLIDAFISEAVGDQWEMNDPLVDKLLEIFMSAWSLQIEVRFPNATFTIEKVLDNESGDIGLRLVSDRVAGPALVSNVGGGN